MTITQDDRQTLAEIAVLCKNGCTSFKTYLTYAGFRLADPAFLNILCAVKESGGIVLVHAENEYFALVNKCPHLGLPLTGSKVQGKTITCPFHNSEFDLCTGENIDWVRGIAGIRLPAAF